MVLWLMVFSLMVFSLIGLSWRDGTNKISVRQECLTGVLRSQITSAKRFSIRRNWRMPVTSSRATIAIDKPKTQRVDRSPPANNRPAEPLDHAHHRVERIEQLPLFGHDRTGEPHRAHIQADKVGRRPLGRPGEPGYRHPAPGDLHVFTGFHGIQEGRKLGFRLGHAECSHPVDSWSDDQPSGGDRHCQPIHHRHQQLRRRAGEPGAGIEDQRCVRAGIPGGSGGSPYNALRTFGA
jgi:hypothetical protein